MTSGAQTEFKVSPPVAIWRWGGTPMSHDPWAPRIVSLLRGFGARFDEHATWATFALPEQFDNARLAMGELTALGIEPVVHYVTVKNPTRKHLHSSKWYSVLYPGSRDGFISDGMFASEWPCELPTPELRTGVHGCSLRKQQTRKLKVARSNRIQSGDYISAWVPFVSFLWQRLVVSARLHDALRGSGLTGFSFLPVAGAEASDEDTLLESGPRATDSTEWFQLVIEGRAKPRPIDEFIPVKRVDGTRDCNICGRQTGEPQLHPLYDEAHLAQTVDMQVTEEFQLPNGRRVMNMDGEVIVSSRFVEFCVDGKFKGLSTLTGKAANFTAMYFGPAV